MHSRFRTSMSMLTRIGLATAVGVVGVAALASPAQAHETPKAGSACAMSGMTEIDHGKAYVCVSRTSGAKPRWGAGLPVSRSPLTLADGWVKAAASGMTAAFGVVKNPTGKPIRIIGAYASIAPILQLHEVVEKDGAMVMQQRTGGFVIPAGGSLELKPGGNHVMFMKLTKPIKAGTMVPVTFITADGGLLKVKVMGKVFSGGNETYDGGSAGMSGM